MTRWVLLAALACGCVYRPLDLPDTPSSTVAPDLGTRDLAMPVDLASPPDLAFTSDLAPARDLTTSTDLIASVVTQVSAGGGFTCAVVGGAAKCWGGNPYGELGNNSTTNSSVPVDVVGLSSGVVAVSSGWGHACALTSTGGLKCWGWNNHGQLGNNSTVDSSVPVEVTGLSSGVIAISVGNWQTCAVTSAGTAKCWGWNGYGQLGNNSTVDSFVPVEVTGLSSGVIAISSSYVHACAVTSTGAARCWGSDGYFELGTNPPSSSLVPVDVAGLANAVAISTGDYHTCTISSGGAAKCWGLGDSGMLGNGSLANSPVPVDVTGLSSGVTAISVSDGHTCALTSAGAMCWGLNTYGQVGDGTVSAGQSIPAHVVGLSSGVSAISAGFQHTCAVTLDGKVKCWGDNREGALGNNSNISSSVPVDVVGL
jgi:alpha-tubulin suppressor-like RCC1 family protein